MGNRTKNHWYVAPLGGTGAGIAFVSLSQGLYQLEDDLHRISYRLTFRGKGVGTDVLPLDRLLVLGGGTWSPTVRTPEERHRFHVWSDTPVSSHSFLGDGAVLQVGGAVGLGYELQVLLFGLGSERYRNRLRAKLPGALHDPDEIRHLAPITCVCHGRIEGFAPPGISILTGDWRVT